MSEAKHTPGPWQYSRDIIFARIPRDGYGTTAVAYVGDEMRHTGGLQYGVERDANGRLISAAPDLLAALKAITNSDMAMREEDEGQQSELIDAARAAIAKAEGKSDAIVKGERGQAVRETSYRKWFRQIATAAGIPASVWNMDTRAGGVTEALEAGASMDCPAGGDAL